MLKNLKIGIRLGVAFGVVLVLLFAVGVFALTEMSVLSSLNQKMYRHPFTATLLPSPAPSCGWTATSSGFTGP